MRTILLLTAVSLAASSIAAGQVYSVQPHNDKAAPSAKGQASKSSPAAAPSGRLGWGSNINNARKAHAAELALQKGDYGTALNYAQSAATSAPDDYQLWYLYGYAARLAGKNSLSVQAYQHALQVKPGAVEGLSGLAQTYIKMGRTDEGEKLLQKVIAEDPHRANDLMIIGELELQTGKYDQALTYLRRAQAIQPSVRADLLTAVAYVRMKQPEKAKALLEAAKRKSPGNPEVLRALASFYREVKDYGNAVAALQQIKSKKPDVLGELAYTYHLWGKNDQAANTYAQAVKLDPKNLNLTLAAAESYLGVADLKKAKLYLDSAQKLDAENYRVHTLQGEVARMEGDYPRALQEYQTAIARMPESPNEGPLYPIEIRMTMVELEKQIGDEAAEQKYVAEAKQMIDALHMDPPTAPYLRLRGTIESAQNNYPAAEADLRQAAQLDPSDPNILLPLGNVLWREKKIKESQDVYESVLKIDPNSKYALSSLGYLSRDQGDMAGAEKWFTRYATAHPEDYAAFLALGDMYTAQRKFAPAQTNYDKAYALNPKQPLIVAGGANAGIEAKQFPLAAQWLARADATMNEEPHLQRERERYLTWTGKYEESSKIGYALLPKLPKDRDVIVYLGYDLLYLQRWDDLLKLTNQYIPELPKDATLPLLRGYVHKHAGDLEEAAADFTTALSLDDKIPTAWVNRGYVLNDLQKPEQAASDFDHALQLEPNNGEAHLGLAYSALQLNHNAQALAEVNTAARILGESEGTYEIRATAYQRQGLLAKAEANYKLAVAKAPTNVKLLTALADTQYRQRKYNEAIATLKSAINLEPDDPRIYASIAHAYAGLNDRNDTIQYVTAAERIGNNDPDILLSTGDALLTVGDEKGAMQRFTRVLETPDADRVQARIAIAKEMEQRGQWDDAKQQLAFAFADSRTDKTQPITTEHLLQSADLMLKMHDFDQAEKMFRAAQKNGTAPQVVAIGLANVRLAEGDAVGAQRELAGVGNMSDYDQSYDYMVAMAQAYRQRGDNVHALAAYARANSLGSNGPNDTTEQDMLDVAEEQGIGMGRGLSFASDFEFNPIWEDETVYTLDARIRGLSANSSLLPPPRSLSELRMANTVRYNSDKLPPITMGFEERNARGSILLPSDNIVVNTNTWDTDFNANINPVLHLGTTTLHFSTGAQFTIRRDQNNPVAINENLIRPYLYMSTSSLFNWISVHGYALHEGGSFTDRKLTSNDNSARVEFVVGRPWGDTSLITGYAVRDIHFDPTIREWFFTSTYAGVEHKFGERTRVRLIGEYLRSWNVQDMIYATAQAMRPAAEVEFRPARHWLVNASGSFSRGEGFHAYDNMTSGFLVTYTKPLRSVSQFDGTPVATEYPLRISFGMQSQSFMNFPGSKSANFLPVIRVSLF